jgi:hypothetical protein
MRQGGTRSSMRVLLTSGAFYNSMMRCVGRRLCEEAAGLAGRKTSTPREGSKISRRSPSPQVYVRDQVAAALREWEVGEERTTVEELTDHRATSVS